MRSINVAPRFEVWLSFTRTHTHSTYAHADRGDRDRAVVQLPEPTFDSVPTVSLVSKQTDLTWNLTLGLATSGAEAAGNLLGLLPETTAASGLRQRASRRLQLQCRRRRVQKPTAGVHAPRRRLQYPALLDRRWLSGENGHREDQHKTEVRCSDAPVTSGAQKVSCVNR